MNLSGLPTWKNLVNDENGYLMADSLNIINRLKNYFSQLLNVHSVNDIRQTEIFTAEQLVTVHCHGHLGDETAIEKLRKYTSLSSEQILEALIQEG
jgi:hypothetical protein